jgi:hypothetical protein
LQESCPFSRKAYEDRYEAMTGIDLSKNKKKGKTPGFSAENTENCWRN